jgi:hypothetical protein
LISNTPVNIYGSFNLSMLIQLPQTFNNYIQVDTIPTQGTPDNSPRVKTCSVVVNNNGENIPCPKCLNSGVLSPFAQNSTVSNIYDSFSYYLGGVTNYNLRTTADNPQVNTIT